MLLAPLIVAVGLQAALFEVASIRPNTDGPGVPPFLGVQGDTFIARNVSVRELIRAAYQVDDPHIIGAPRWLEAERFDLTAKMRGGPEQWPQMLRTLLADRFRLSARRETRDLPVYALVLARTDGTLGPRLVRTEDCRAVNRRLCGGEGVSGRVAFWGMPIASLARTTALAREVGRPVIDRTGLTGFFDGTVEWSLTEGPSVFAALQEQLGLRLEAATAPLDVVVIDTVDRPAAN